MNEQQLRITIGGLLHDIGKGLYRASDSGDHGHSGYVFLKDEVGINDQEILDQVRFHHAAVLKDADLPSDSPVYITYYADNVASAVDRRERPEGAVYGFDKSVPLDSVFNILNGNHGNSHYKAGTLERKEGIHYPVEDAISYDASFYKKIKDNLKDILGNLEYSERYVNSLLEVLEANLSYISSSTSKKERADISLYDHMKLTSAIGNCVYGYLREKGITDYRDYLFTNGRKAYEESMFFLLSIDMSGIQAFIYSQYGNKDVLKNLRSRSFYLEIMMENMIDDLMEEAGLSRTNLIYSGGGHAYLLMQNTASVKETIDAFEQSMNEWLCSWFQADLYAAFGYTSCSANDLRNAEPGSYRNIFKQVSNALSAKKRKRYDAAAILRMNTTKREQGERECRICHRSDRLVGEDLCEICSGLISLSEGILSNNFFTVLSGKEDPKAIAIGKDRFLLAETESQLRERIQKQEGYIRSYCKNDMFTGKSLASKLWVGDYSSASTLNDLVKAGAGIRRLGVLRADVDNLGQAIVNGFPEQYQTLSRTATFSRQLSLFFKLHINDLLENGSFSLDGGSRKRNATIIYSGGDDVFIVGAWKDILEFSIDLYEAFKKFTRNTLTISAGFNIYKPTYPISYIAEQTGNLEDCSKQMEGKNAVTLFEEEHSYHWEELINRVIGEKFKIIQNFFGTSEERGKNFLYGLLELLKNSEEKINLARLAYMLARLEPDRKAEEEQKEAYKIFSKKIYEWSLHEKDRREAITAIYLYAYLIREGDTEDDIK